MKKQIPAPSHWQDFEDLCETLFGEVWDCKLSITKHGRSGQKQQGVDVYAIPKGEHGYYGIQCKGKDNNFGKNLTIKEIDKEISKALEFIPKLKVFIFATTAPKDGRIEEYIRTKNIESIKNGNFQILIKAWEDLADLIRKNERTYKSYMLNKQFEEQNSVSLTFNGETHPTIKPKFKKIITHHTLEKHLDIEKHFSSSPINRMPISFFEPSEINHTWCSVEMEFTNTGSIILENWEIFMKIESGARKIIDDEPTGIQAISMNLAKYRKLFVNDDDKTIQYIPLENKPLVPKKNRIFKWHFLPENDAEEIKISWKILSSCFNLESETTILLQKEFEIIEKYITVANKKLVSVEEVVTDLIKVSI
ncbi:MAG: hypothetical protein R3279_06540 [Putridiphycobacter sp.]|nr:hypothetical protein [Putridiphycobacter sp.]